MIFVLLPFLANLLRLDGSFFQCRRISNRSIQEFYLICGISLSYSMILNIFQGYWKYLDILKAILDHFHNFLHELNAKLLDFLLIAVKGPLNTKNLFKISRTEATFENLKYCVGGISVSLCVFCYQELYLSLLPFTCLPVLNATDISNRELGERCCWKCNT